jgi:hypothetical protein
MSDENRVTREEQEQMGLLRRTANFVAPPFRSQAIVRRMSADETTALTAITQSAAQPSHAIQLPSIDSTHTSHTRDVSTPVEHAKASLLYSVAIMAVSAFVIGALLILSGVCEGDPGAFFGLEIVGTGVVGMIALAVNRLQGLHHSATGIAHAEVKTRERMYGRLVEAQEYQIDADKEVKLAEIDMRRQLGRSYLGYLESGKKDDHHV